MSTPGKAKAEALRHLATVATAANEAKRVADAARADVDEVARIAHAQGATLAEIGDVVGVTAAEVSRRLNGRPEAMTVSTRGYRTADGHTVRNVGKGGHRRWQLLSPTGKIIADRLPSRRAALAARPQ